MPFDLQIENFENRKNYKINADLAANLKAFYISYIETLDKI